MENALTFELSKRFIVGAVLVLAAVAIAIPATLSNIRTAESAREKRYLGWTCLGTWITVLLGILLVVNLPDPWHYIVMGLLMIIFPLGIFRISMHRHVIREQEAEKRNKFGDPASKNSDSTEVESE